MSAMILAFYIDFFSHFTKEIIEGITIYGEFCRKYDVRMPVIFKTQEGEKASGSRFQPLPTKELKAAYEVLISNPRIKVEIK